MSYPTWAARWKAAARHHRQKERQLLGLWSRLLVTSARRTEECATLTTRAERAEAGAAAMREALDEAIALCHIPERDQDEDWYARLSRTDIALATNDAGAALLTELAAARAVIAAASAHLEDAEGAPSDVEDALAAALDAYEAAKGGADAG